MACIESILTKSTFTLLTLQVSDGPCPENQGPIIEAVEFEEDFEVQNCPDVCIQIFQPVCGTDGEYDAF